MPTRRFHTPTYRLHKASGQAVVTLNGRDVYLGKYGTDASRERYRAALNEWLAGNRVSLPTAENVAASDLTLNEVYLPYAAHAEQYYRKYGEPTSEIASIRRAMSYVLDLYGRQPAAQFGPIKLTACRQRMIDAGLARGVINKHVDRIKRFFKWAVANELIPPAVYHGLQTVSGLRRGRSAAPESKPVRPVPDEWIDAVLPHVNRQVAAMIQLQRYTGMRPGEVLIMRGCDLDMTGPVWIYTPRVHKTEHHDRERQICLGPRAQQVLGPFLTGDADAYLFSPRQAMAELRAERRARRKTPLPSGQRRPRPQRKLKKRPGERYSLGSYEHAIKKGCDKALPPPPGLSEAAVKQWRKEHHWAPNRLRHSAATFLRKEFGIEAARVILGHSSAAITEIYAEMDRSKAVQIMGRVG